MRFDDTEEGWLKKIEEIKSNKNLMNFIAATSKEEIQLVRVRKKGKSGTQPQHMCHDNVKGFVEKHGGKQVYGWLLHHWDENETPEYDGVFTAIFHSNWLTPEGALVSITPYKSEYQIFLTDPRRSFDFSKNESYNNRVIFLDIYDPPRTAVNPSRNVTYFRSGVYIDRDRFFEKYRIPSSQTEVIEAIPESMKRIIGGSLALSGEGKRWASLKYSVSL